MRRSDTHKTKKTECVKKKEEEKVANISLSFFVFVFIGLCPGLNDVIAELFNTLYYNYVSLPPQPSLLFFVLLRAPNLLSSSSLFFFSRPGDASRASVAQH